MPASSEKTRFNFTEARIRDWPKPTSGRIRLKDASFPGLACYVTPTAKIFYFYGKANGRPVDVRLGKWPTMTVEAAQKKMREEVAPDPQAAQEEKRATRSAQTVADAWEALLAHPWRRDGKAPLRPATLVSYKAAWEHLKPHLGTRALADVDGRLVAEARNALLVKYGAAQTRRALALLVVLLGGRMPRDDNGRAIGKPTMQPRRRFMNAAELGALLRGLAAEPPLWRVFWMCCLLAPLRRGNIASARWSDLNLDHPARWIVGGDEAKGGKLLAMPIAGPLATILRDWKDQNPRAEWVFPAGLTAGPRKSTGPIVSVQHAWARALLLGEAIRLCDAIAVREGLSGRERFAGFIADVERMRVESLRMAQVRQPMERGGTPLTRAVDALRKQAKGMGIDPEPLAMRDLTPHDLRRTAASWAVQAGASLAVVAASLGHADTRVTEAHYGHLSDDPVRRMLGENAGRILATVPSLASNDSA
jgi:integrase